MGFNDDRSMPILSTSLKKHTFLFAALSGMLLILCFPDLSWGWLAWGALVPWILAIRNAPSKAHAVLSGTVAGAVFFGVSLYWFIHVHFWAWFGVTFIETAFFTLFAWLAYEVRAFRSPLIRILWTAAAWLTVEVLRSEVPIFGLGWSLLAFSQAGHIKILQFASMFGAYGLGFVIAFVNAVAVELMTMTGLGREILSKEQIRAMIFGGSRRAGAGLLVTALMIPMVFLALLGAGNRRLLEMSLPRHSVRIALIQGNIPQEIKWNYTVREKILEKYEKLTELSQYEQPDIAIWPEASFPGYLNRDELASGVRNLARTLQLPLLVGSCHLETLSEVYNSAYLIDGRGTLRERYDKQYLVPFGEYVPLKPIFGWLEPVAYAMGVSDFYGGNQSVVFKMPNDNAYFSVLICFEDVFPNLARRAAESGAQWLAVITNDAWFGKSPAARQHLQASVFRAVENGLPVVRSANTGVSAFISATGVVSGRVHDKAGRDIFVTGEKTQSVDLFDQKTFYGRAGWIFPYAVSILLIFFFFARGIRAFFVQNRFGFPKKRPETASRGGLSSGKADSSVACLRSLVWAGLLISSPAFCGCVRLAGTAGYAYQGPSDESPKVKQLGFDTQRLIPSDQTPGNIE